MKKYKFLLIMIAFGALLFTACEERDFPNPNDPALDVVPDQALVSGVEAGTRDELAIYLRVVGSLGREVYYFEPADPRYTGNLLRGTPDPGGFLVLRPWSARYSAARIAEEILSRAAGKSGEEANGLIGYAKTMRAYELLLNLNYMDDNGIKIELSTDINTPFVSKQEALNHINSELDDAHTALGSAGSSFPFTLSDGFASGGFDTPAGFDMFNRALRARVAAYDKDWDGVLSALSGSFIDAAGDLNHGVYLVYGTGVGDQTNGIYENPEASFVKLMAHPSFGTDAEAGDGRFASKVLVRDLDGNGQPDTTKFDDLQSTMSVTITSSSTDPVYIIRNEELLLLRAEANIQKGNYSDAATDINVIRAAYGLAPVTLDAGNAVDQLLHERRYSLFMEGHRWVDMRRYGKLGDLPVDRDGDTVLDKMPKPETEIPG